MKPLLRIATRKSPLALWQAEHVKARLQQVHPGLAVELVTMSTQGDKILDTPLAKIGGKGLFVKELEQGMLEGRADIAAHSIKDVPMEFPEGLFLSTILEREEPCDAFVSNKYNNLDELPQGAVVGTSSLRRRCQLLNKRPDLRIEDLRGNVNTRLSKLDDGKYDAIILACAGLIRLEMENRIKQRLSADLILPAVGQGAIGLEAREGDEDTLELVSVLDHPTTRYRVLAERRSEGAGYLRSRNGHDITAVFPDVARAVGSLPYDGLVLDGELVILDEEGRPNFHRLQRRSQLRRRREVERATVLGDVQRCEGADEPGVELDVERAAQCPRRRAREHEKHGGHGRGECSLHAVPRARMHLARQMAPTVSC